jgi:hypothetical protein
VQQVRAEVMVHRVRSEQLVQWVHREVMVLLEVQVQPVQLVLQEAMA